MSELFEKEFVSAYTNKSDMHSIKYLKSLCDDEDVNHVTEMGLCTGDEYSLLRHLLVMLH